MIFLTVGSQLPFDRLTKSVDEWAQMNPNIEVFGQIGITDYVPKHMQFAASLNPFEYQSMLDGSDIIISHVGMGTIISALDKGKPLLVLPRVVENGEVRNNHQLSTIKFIKDYKLITVVDDESEISNALDKIIVEQEGKIFQPERLKVSPKLVNKIHDFINS